MKLNYKEFGQGPPLIILHGLFGSLDNWQTLAKQFAAQFNVYIIDQRNHGRSPHDPEMSYELMAEDLRAFMESKWMFSAYVMGHSMGGKTAMQFALNFPDWVNKLVVVDMHPAVNKGGHELIFEALLSMDLKTLESRKAADVFLEKKIPEYSIRQFLLKNLGRDKENGGFRWKMNLQAIYNGYESILAEVSGEASDVPALFIKGEQSDYIREDRWQEVLQLFPQARLHAIPSAGHWVHADAPDALFEEVVTFLQT